MVTIAQKNIAKSMLAFQDSIRFETYDNPLEFVKEAIDSNPKIAYYLHGYSIRGALNRYEIIAQYIHKETKPEDIFVVNSDAECIHYMCRSVGNYKKKLIIVVNSSVNHSKAADEFCAKHATFYPNLTRVSNMGYHHYGDYSVIEYSFDYRIGQVKLNMMEREVDAEVEKVSRLLFLPGMPVEAKIYLAHNYLASTVLYRDNNKNRLDSSYTQSAYGALIKKECVCQGYSEAFKRIMDYNCIESDIVSGQIVGTPEYHAWNIVSLGKDNSYYHIDVTWDSNGSRPRYLYFCKNDSYFDGKRIWNRELFHSCSGKHAVLSIARSYVFQNKRMLTDRGIDIKIIDC